MTLLECLENSKVKEAPSEYFLIRDAHREHMKNETWRLRACPLESGATSLESDEGDGYRFTDADLTATDWLVLPNEVAVGVAV